MAAACNSSGAPGRSAARSTDGCSTCPSSQRGALGGISGQRCSDGLLEEGVGGAIRFEDS